SQAKKVGDSVGDWQVVEIHEKSVVVAGENGTRQTIDINEAAAQGRDYSRTGAAAPAAPPVTVLAPTPPAPGQTATPVPAPATPVPAGNAAPGEQPKPRILNTPFGPIIRTDPQ